MEDCIGVTIEDIQERHYLQQAQEKSKAKQDNTSKLAVDSVDGSGAYRPFTTTVAAGGGRKLVISETPVEGRDLTVTELSNKKVPPYLGSPGPHNPDPVHPWCHDRFARTTRRPWRRSVGRP